MNDFIGEVLKVPHHCAHIAVVGLGLNVGAVFQLCQFARHRVVHEVAVATVPIARLGLTVIAVGLHVFPTSGQSDEVGEVTE
ncbi:hypothetical protein D3C86_1978430 [compost metagenome]